MTAKRRSYFPWFVLALMFLALFAVIAFVLRAGWVMAENPEETGRSIGAWWDAFLGG